MSPTAESSQAAYGCATFIPQCSSESQSVLSASLHSSASPPQLHASISLPFVKSYSNGQPMVVTENGNNAMWENHQPEIWPHCLSGVEPR
jgi:hypothetical protein